MAEEYYRMEWRRLTLPEYWRILPTFRAFVRAVVRHKLLGIQPAGEVAVQRLDRLELVSSEAVPEPLADVLVGLTTAFASAGMRRSLVYRSCRLGQARRAFGAGFRSDDGQIFAIVEILSPRWPNQEARTVEIVSLLEGDGLLNTANLRKRLATPADYAIERLPSQSVADLVARHRERLTRVQGRVRPVAEAELADVIVHLNNRKIDFHAERGVYARLTDAEVARLKAIWQDEEDANPELARETRIIRPPG